MKSIQVFLILVLFIFLADTCLAGFIPAAFEGEFTQIKQKRRGGKREAPVNIKYSFPKRIRMEISENNIKTMYICNPETTWIYTGGLAGEPGQVRVGKSSKYCYSQIFDALNLGLKDNKHYTVNNESLNTYLLSFNAGVTKKIGYEQVRIFFKDQKLEFNNISKLQLVKKGSKDPMTLEKNALSKMKSTHSLVYAQLIEAINLKLKDNKNYKSTDESVNKFLLSFTEAASKRLGYDQVRIFFKDKNHIFNNITKLDLINKGARAPITLQKNSIKIMKALSPSVFQFKIPAKTEIQQMK